MAEREWKDKISIPDGKHEGKIIRTETRTEPYKYYNIFVEVKVGEKIIELKHSVPDHLSESSKLGKLLIRFGEKFEAGKKVDPDTIFIGKKVSFMALTEKKEKDGEIREFITIVDGSLKPN